MHIPLLIVRTERLQEVATAMTTVGHATGCAAGDAVATFNGAMEDRRRFRKRVPRVLFVAWADPLYVAGRQTFIDDLYKLTGAANAADVVAWPQYSLEALVAHPPDLLLYPTPGVSRDAIGAILGRAHLPLEAAAVDANLFTRAGPRMPQAASALNAICDRWERTR